MLGAQLIDPANQALQVFRFRNSQEHRMVRRRPAPVKQAHLTMGVAGRSCHNTRKLLNSNMMRAGASNQSAPRTQHLQRPQVQLFVSPKCSLGGTLRFRKGRRIKHNRIEPRPAVAPVPEQVKGISLDPLHRLLPRCCHHSDRDCAPQLPGPRAMRRLQ